MRGVTSPVLFDLEGWDWRRRRGARRGRLQVFCQTRSELGGVEEGETGVDDLKEDFYEIEGEAE